MNTEENGSVLIIGCGWVGKKLGEYLFSKGMIVYGTTRSSSNFSALSAHHIKPVKLELPAAKLSDIRLPETDAVIISIAPGRGKSREDYPKSINQLSQILSDGNTQVIMYSSSSVYENATANTTEEEVQPNTKSEHAILATEGELRAQIPDSVIMRLSGLYGDDRHPVTYLSGRKGIKNGNAPVNLVHREDVIRATDLIISQNIRGEIFNVCAPTHPPKKDIYTTIAERLKLKTPKFLDEGEEGKVVSSQKLIKKYGFEFLHEDPIEFEQESL